ncbi:MAG: hypothetical protein HDT14_04760 [Oscillibacter sp.]|nr:hypothetical protein [Oscillibacter sp.]
MTNFEKIAASPETLGAFLANLTVASGPWDEEFHKVFCVGCGQADCGACTHEKERNNPLWWLAQVVEGEQDASRTVWRNGRVEPGRERSYRYRTRSATPTGLAMRSMCT